MKSQIAKKIDKDRGYEALRAKRDVSGQVEFEHIIAIDTTGVTVAATLSTQWDGDLVAWNLIGRFTGMGTKTGAMTLFVNGSDVASVSGSGTETLSPSSMANLHNPSFSLQFSPTAGTANLTLVVKKEQLLDQI